MRHWHAAGRPAQVLRGSVGAALTLALVLSLLWATQESASAADAWCGADGAAVCRVSGSGRVETAVQVSAQFWDTSQHAILATARGFPDALAGAVLANRLDAPLLLTEPHLLPDSVDAELSRLQVDAVTILGGRGAVSTTVEDALRDRGIEVSRLHGSNRFATAAAIAEAAGPSSTGEVVLALGQHPNPASAWPDAVASGALAATPDRIPTLLTRATDLPAETELALASLRPRTVIVVGGPGAVSEDVEQRVAALGYQVRRLAGASRYETSAAVATEALQRFPDTERSLVFATGQAFPDALSAAALAGRVGAPLLLVPPTHVPTSDAWLAVLDAAQSLTGRGVVVGGAGAVSDSVVTDLSASLRLPPPAPLGDAYQRRVRAELGVFTDWLAVNGVKGYVGEVSWPNSYPQDMDRYNALADSWFDAADAAGLWVSAWAAGEWWKPEYKMAVYVRQAGERALTTPRPQATVVEGHASTSTYSRGVNLNGGEFGAGVNLGTGSGGPFSNTNPGVYDRDWHYDSQATMDFLASRGHEHVRILFRWERLQPVPGGPLDPTEMQRIKDAVARAHAAGMEAIPSVANYGAYWVGDGTNGVRRAIGSAEMPVSHFTSLWRQLSSELAGNPGVAGYQLMVEPVGMPGATRRDQAVLWERTSQAALDAIRANGDTTQIFVPGYHYSGVQRWSTHHPQAWITDPADNHRYEAHHYWSSNNDGNYKTYDEELALATARGY